MKKTMFLALVLTGCATQPAWIERERNWYRENLINQLQTQLQACNEVTGGKCLLQQKGIKQ